MAQFTRADLSGSRFERVDLAEAEFHAVFAERDLDALQAPAAQQEG